MPRFILIIIGFGWSGALCVAQTNPTPQTLPFSQDFGTVPFNSLPAGIGAWGGLSGSTVSSESLAASSIPTVDSTLTAISSTSNAGGSFGLGMSGNARFNIQTSGSPPNGANQLILAINTTGQGSAVLSYDAEGALIAPRSVGALCQYRVGISGTWTTLTARSGSNPFIQAGSSSTVLQSSTVIDLPTAAISQPIVQIRWAVWRGTEGGNSSGITIDNISVTGTPSGDSLSVAVAPSTITENSGVDAIVTVTTAAPVTTMIPVTLSGNSSRITIDAPNPASIPIGQSSVTFKIRTVDNSAVDGNQSVTLTATSPSATPGSAVLTVLDDEDAFSPPTGYYQNAQSLSGIPLKNVLKTIITTESAQFSYSGTLAPLRLLHQDPANPANLLTVYSGSSIGKFDNYYSGQSGDTTWSREHVWPVSFGLDTSNVDPGFTDADAGADYTDLFNLRPALQTVNSSRSNLFYDESTGTTTVPTLAPLCSKDTNSWEPRAVEKGDLARTILYMATRYDGTDPNTIDLEVGETASESAGRFAKLSTLLQWHIADPVSPEERKLNQSIFTSYQKNRNPFIDHPEYVAMIWGGTFLTSKLTAAVTEGGATDSYTIVLTSPPSSTVEVAIATSPTAQITAMPSTLIFTAANWNQPQTVILTAVDDVVYETSLTATVTHSVATTDTKYTALAPSNVSVTVTDNDPQLAPASLPIQMTGPWIPLPTPGFLGTGLDVYNTNLGGETGTSGSLKFDNTGDRLTISYIGSAKSASYRLKGNPSTFGTFFLLQSADGITFTTVRTVTDKTSTDVLYTDDLLATSRYVSFVYQQKTSGNIQLDQLSITTTPWFAWQSDYNISNSSPTADMDDDGLPNLAEYALGSSPASSSQAGFPTLEKTTTKSRITAMIRISDPSLLVKAETTTDLSQPNSWTATGITKLSSISQTGVAAGFERMTFEISDSSQKKRFLRLRFDLN